MSYKIPPTNVLEVEGMVIQFDDNPELAHEVEAWLKINPDDLSAEFVHQAADYGYLAVQQARAEYAASVAKAELERVYAAADNAVRAEYAENDWKYTEAIIKAAVIRAKAYIAANARYLELEYNASVLKVITNALKQRADMLISLGAMTRQEIAMTGFQLADSPATEAKKSIQRLRNQKPATDDYDD